VEEIYTWEVRAYLR